MTHSIDMGIENSTADSKNRFCSRSNQGETTGHPIQIREYPALIQVKGVLSDVVSHDLLVWIHAPRHSLKEIGVSLRGQRLSSGYFRREAVMQMGQDNRSVSR